MIYGSVDNGTPNANIFFITEDKEKAEEIYKKLQRLKDLQFPKTKELKKEHDKIYQELQEDEIELFSEDDWIDDTPVDWDLNPMIEFKEVLK